MSSRKERKKKCKKYISNISNESFKQLAKNNVKKSMKDYMIYFLTLSFGATLLYTFNSIDNNLSLLNGNGLLDPYVYMSRGILTVFSVIICIIFAFLITYSNNFLMKKRKREFGIYTSLGMDKRDINKLMFKETTIIGALSLALGLIFGIFVSQGLSIITFKMLNLDSSTFRFSISISSLIKTIILFGLSLCVVNKLNKKTIKKYKLIDLINANKKNESSISKSSFSGISIFILSIVLMIGSYFVLFQDRINVFMICISISLIVLATYLFFISVSDFVVKQIKKRKKMYYNNLNMFVISQMSSRIKTMSFSVTIICLIIFSALIIIPFGMGTANYLYKDLGKDSPYSATIRRYSNDDYDNPKLSNDKSLANKKYTSLKDDLIKSNFPFDKLVKSYSEVKVYKLKNITFAKLLPKRSSDNYPISIVSISDYNNARKQQGLNPIPLEKNGFVINSSSSGFKNSFEDLIKNNKNLSLNINGYNLNLSQDKLYSINYYDKSVMLDSGTIIVQDEVLDNLYPTTTYLNCNYIELNNDYDRKFLDAYYNFHDTYNDYDLSFNSKLVIDGEKIALNTSFSFIAIYLGVVLLISAGAILALQQISESTINKERFDILRRLGVNESDLKKAIFMQAFIFFMIPLGLAILHSLFFSKFLYSLIIELSSVGITKNIFITLVIVAIVYGSYFFASYYESLDIINNKENI